MQQQLWGGALLLLLLLPLLHGNCLRHAAQHNLMCTKSSYTKL
jgi:hypothetical protein